MNDSYWVLEEDNRMELISRVKSYIDAGWVCQGGICAFDRNGMIFYSQAMQRYFVTDQMRQGMKRKEKESP